MSGVYGERVESVRRECELSIESLITYRLWQYVSLYDVSLVCMERERGAFCVQPVFHLRKGNSMTWWGNCDRMATL